jgi:hypothetical protein
VSRIPASKAKYYCAILILVSILDQAGTTFISATLERKGRGEGGKRREWQRRVLL